MWVFFFIPSSEIKLNWKKRDYLTCHLGTSGRGGLKWHWEVKDNLLLESICQNVLQLVRFPQSPRQTFTSTWTFSLSNILDFQQIAVRLIILNLLFMVKHQHHENIWIHSMNSECCQIIIIIIMKNQSFFMNNLFLVVYCPNK